MYNFHILSKHTFKLSYLVNNSRKLAFRCAYYLLVMLFHFSLITHYNFSILAWIFPFIHHLMACSVRICLWDWKKKQSEWYWYWLRDSSANYYYEMRFSAINFASSIVVTDKPDTRVHKICIFINFVSFAKKISILSKFAKKGEKKTMKFPCMFIQNDSIHSYKLKMYTVCNVHCASYYRVIRIDMKTISKESCVRKEKPYSKSMNEL